jgi:hypothetical protein
MDECGLLTRAFSAKTNAERMELNLFAGPEVYAFRKTT